MAQVCRSCGAFERKLVGRICLDCAYVDALNRIRTTVLSGRRRSDFSARELRLHDQALALAFTLPRVKRRRESGRMRQARRRGAGGSTTAAQAAVILRAQGGGCAYCGSQKELQFDHMVPVSRGGTSWPWNMQWLCAKHNLAKGATTDFEFRVKFDLPQTSFLHPFAGLIHALIV